MPDGTLDTVGFAQISRTGLSPTMVWLPNHFCYPCACVMQSTTPQVLLPVVWPLSISLAATLEIDVSFSSSAYLDVSVQRVSFRTLWIHVRMHRVFLCGFPHSEICGYNGYLLLTAAYRSLSRPSSAPDAKAFSLRS